MTDLTAETAIEALAPHRADMIVVSTMTSIKWVEKYLASPLNVPCVPLMGGSGALGLGLALAQPERKVIILDGDGSLLMQLGTLVSIAEAAPSNLCHVVFNNGVWFENMVNIPVPGRDTCAYAQMAKAAGFKTTLRCSRLEKWQSALKEVLGAQGPTFVELKIKPESGAIWTKDNPQPEMPEQQFKKMGAQGRTLREHLLVS